MATSFELHDWAHAFFDVIKPLLPSLKVTAEQAKSDLVFSDNGLIMPDVLAGTLIVRLLDRGFIETNGMAAAHAYQEVQVIVDPLHPERGLVIARDDEEPHLFCVAFFNYEL